MNKKLRNNTKFGLWLKHLMIDEGITQSGIAKVYGCHDSLISFICTGRRSIPKDFKYVLRDKFNVSEEKLKEFDEVAKIHDKERKLMYPTYWVFRMQENKHNDAQTIMKNFSKIFHKLDEKDFEAIQTIIKKHEN